MNEFYVGHWPDCATSKAHRSVCKRTQLRFSSTVERLGVGLVSSIMTLMPFSRFSSSFRTGERLAHCRRDTHALVWAAVFWSVFVGVLPQSGIKFGTGISQSARRSAYRKELVYGEDHEDRADPITLRAALRQRQAQLFSPVFPYMYFNIAAFSTCRPTISSTFVLSPAIVAGKLTSCHEQVLNVFGQVRESFQYSSIPGRPSSSCCRSTNASKPSRRCCRRARCRRSTAVHRRWRSGRAGSVTAGIRRQRSAFFLQPRSSATPRHS